MKNIKNYLFILLSLSYFGLFYSIKNGIINIDFLNLNFVDFKYFENIISYINAIFGLILFIYIFNIFQNKINPKIDKIFKGFKFKNLFTTLVKKFINISKFIISIYIGVNISIIPEKLQFFVDKIFNVSFLIAAIILLTSLVNGIFKELLQKENNDSMSKHVFPILNKFSVIFIWIVGLITILSNLGYNISALITGAGVGGLAIALASQKTVANIFGAVSVIVNRPFKIGDFIGIGSYTGVVKDIGLTYLTLTSTGGNDILIPNETIISSSIENLSIRENRRVDLALGVEYSTSNEKIKLAISLVENVFKKYKLEGKISNYRAHFDNFGDFSLNILAVYFSEIEGLIDHNKMVNEINLEIKELFEQNQIEIAFPTQKIIK
ncbi:MAG: mechanosensitive ion channel family protein [Candidatus Gracilibacteria bacterium]|nr:mechanosensitive ion channel family protein [Candidatus Gracilibacteria bacterium]